MEQIVQYIKPELLIVSVILYFIGIWHKQAQTVKDKYIPLFLGGLGIALCAVWVLATSPLRTGPEIAMAAFTAIVQGVLVAGLSTYVNQIIEQAGKYSRQNPRRPRRPGEASGIGASPYTAGTPSWAPQWSCTRSLRPL